MYTVKSTSSEGVYYLYKGWGCSGTTGIMFDKNIPHLQKHLFMSKKSAKASITKLLKIMDEYKDDVFEILSVDKN